MLDNLGITSGSFVESFIKIQHDLAKILLFEKCVKHDRGGEGSRGRRKQDRNATVPN